ncbi:MAG: succinate dehydrogenase assembly factor 2 [Gammaproteobacteria bacterium]
MSAPKRDAHHKGRLRWRCRRGMKELDVLFERFIERGFDALGVVELEPLALLLEQPDQDIYAWLTAKVEPEEPQLRLIVRKIRADVGLAAR